MSTPLAFGLTGGIACGKTTVARLFAQHGIPVVDADALARELVVPGSYGLSQLVHTFGTEYLHPDGTLNRQKIGARTFSDPDALKTMTALMTPLIVAAAEQKIRGLEALGEDIVCFEAALLVQMGLRDRYRPLVAAYADPDIQLARLRQRNGYTETEARARIAAQLPAAETARLADVVIDTNGSFERVERQVETLIQTLQAWAERPTEDRDGRPFRNSG